MSNKEFLESISLKGEEWRDVVGYEGYYMVSNFGRVYSCNRIIVTKRGVNRRLKGRILQSKPNGKTDHQVVHLNKNCTAVDAYVHRLVGLHFIPNPNNYQIVEHIDSNPMNNHYSNLRWTTQTGNMNNPISKERNSISQRLSSRKKRTPVVCLKDGVVINTYPSMISAESDGFKDSCIDGVIRGKYRHHKGYQWMRLSDYENLKSVSQRTLESVGE